MRAAVQARLDEFTSTAQRRGVASVETRMLEDDARFALLLESRYADLVVVSREAEPITVPARQSSDPVRPLAQDKRFSDPAWSAWPWHQRWQDFLPYVDPDNWQARVPQADGSWWPAWESRLTPCGFKRGAAGAAGECSAGTGQLRVAGVNGCAAGNQWPARPATPAQQLQQQQRQLQEQRTGNKPAFFLLHARTCYTQPNQTAPTRSLRPLPNFRFQPNAASSHPALE